MLLNYGFALENNRYDSFAFYVNMAFDMIQDVSFEGWLSEGAAARKRGGDEQPPLLHHIMPNTKSHPIKNRLLLNQYHIGLPGIKTNTIRLKKDRLCTRLWSYIRIKLQFERNQIQGISVPLGGKKLDISFSRSICQVQSDLDFELETLKIYKEFIKHFLCNPKWNSTLEDDLEELEVLKSLKGSTDKQGRQKHVIQFLLIYRIEQKKIVQSNLTLVEWLTQVVQKTKTLIDMV